MQLELSCLPAKPVTEPAEHPEVSPSVDILGLSSGGLVLWGGQGAGMAQSDPCQEPPVISNSPLTAENSVFPQLSGCFP